MNKPSTFLIFYISALVLLALGFRGTWLFIFVWLPPTLCLWNLLRTRGLFTCLFDPFAILNLAYIYMLFDYVSYSFLCLIRFAVPAVPVSPSFFVALLLGSAFCSLGGSISRPLAVNKLLAAASLFGHNSPWRISLHWRDIIARRLLILPLVAIGVLILRVLSSSAFAIPAIQITSFAYLFAVSLRCPRQFSASLFLFFAFDYFCLFAFLNSSTLSFGNRSSALQPFVLASAAFAISLSSAAFVRSKENKLVVEAKPSQFLPPAAGQNSITISKNWLLIIIGVLCAFAFLIASTITKFSGGQGISPAGALAYYFSPFIAQDGLELRATVANYLVNSFVSGRYTFYQLAQLFTSFVPSELFPGKPEYDIPVLLFESKVYPTPIYFEPFLGQYADLGVVGPVFYAAFLYFFHRFYFLIVAPRSGLSLHLWISLQPLLLYGTIFFMQTPWHFARSCLFIIVMLLLVSVSLKILRLLLPYGFTTKPVK